MIGIYGFLGFKASKVILLPLMNINTKNLISSYLFLKNIDTHEVIDKYIAVSFSKQRDDLINIADYSFTTDMMYTYLFEKDKQSELFKDTLNKILNYDTGTLRSYYSKIKDDAKKIITKHYHYNNNVDDLNEMNDLYRILYPSKAYSLLAKRITSTDPYNYEKVLNIIKEIGEYGSVVNIERETLMIYDDQFNAIKANMLNVKSNTL